MDVDRLMRRFSEIDLHIKIKREIKEIKSAAKVSIKIKCYKILFNFYLN